MVMIQKNHSHLFKDYDFGLQGILSVAAIKPQPWPHALPQLLIFQKGNPISQRSSRTNISCNIQGTWGFALMSPSCTSLLSPMSSSSGKNWLPFNNPSK